MKSFFALLIFTSIFLTGCATIFNSGSDQININSQPTGAKIFMNGQLMGITPANLDLPPKNTYYLEFRKPGFENKSYMLSGTVGGGWVILDVVFGLVPLIVDASTGSWYNYPSNYISIDLEDVMSNTTDSVNLKYDDLPSSFSVKLVNGEPTMLLGEKIYLVYQSSKWDVSSLSASNISGFLKNLSDNSTNKSIHVEKHDIFYIKINPTIIYRVEVTQEVMNTLSLDFTRS